MTYEEAIELVRFNAGNPSTEQLNEAADVLEKERKRWGDLKNTLVVMKAFSIKLEKKGCNGLRSEAIQSIIDGMNEMEK
jgi:hypothetical protein